MLQISGPERTGAREAAGNRCPKLSRHEGDNPVTKQHIVLSEETVTRALDELAHLRGRVAVLEQALRDVRALAGDRERFVMLGPRAFVATVRIVDAVLGSVDPEKPAVQP
jgi:hypothetical protein